MIATWVLGLWLAWLIADSHARWFLPGWLWAKIVLVLALSAVHGLFARWVKAFTTDQNRHSQKFYRIINEVPTIIMIAIVLLVVLKPF
jgi:putative membrane protein